MDELFDTDIQWRLLPLPDAPMTPADPSTSDERGLLYGDICALDAHVERLQAAGQGYRVLLQCAVEEIARLTTANKKQAERLQRQTEQIQTFIGLEAGGW